MIDNNIFLTIVVSVYNEELSLLKFHKELSNEINKNDFTTEILYVNDGSFDSSAKILENISSSEKSVKIISFSRNYGHEAAMIAGIDNAVGTYIICLDADLQHPPSLISKMVAKAKEGADLVLMKRQTRKDGNIFLRLFSKLFYKLINSISPFNFENNASDFFLISNKISNVLRNDFRERIRFLRGYIQLVGFKKHNIFYDAPERFDGKSKYDFRSLVSLSTKAITSFSKLPLKLGISIGLIGLVLSLLIGGYSLLMHFFDDTPSGYTSIIVTIALMSSIQFILIGFIGIYVGYLFDEIKRRPIYIIDNIISND